MAAGWGWAEAGSAAGVWEGAASSRPAAQAAAGSAVVLATATCSGSVEESWEAEDWGSAKGSAAAGWEEAKADSEEAAMALVSLAAAG